MSQPHAVAHDDLVRALRAVARETRPAAVARAFVVALRSRRPAHWSVLASFAFARTLPEHDFEAMPAGRACRTCAAVARVDAFASDVFARDRAAGIVRTDSPRYALFDLHAFAADAADADPAPAEADRAFFEAIVARLVDVPMDGTAFAAERALGMLLPSRIERKSVLAALGVCGVLDSPAHPGFWPAFVPFAQRASLDASPYAYPLTWWRREYGVDAAALHAFGLSGFLSQRTVRRCERSVAAREGIQT